MEQNTTEYLEKFFEQILKHPELITFKVGAFDFLHDCYEVKTMTANEFAHHFKNLKDIEAKGIEITMHQLSKKSHRGLFTSLFSRAKKSTFIHNANACQGYCYIALNTISEKTVKVYFPAFLDYPATPDAHEYNPFYDYFTPQLDNTLGILRAIQVSVLIGRYYEVSEGLKYFLFDPSEDANSILVICHQDTAEYPFCYHPDLYDWLTPTENNVSITIAPLTASTLRGAKSSDYLTRRQAYLQAFINFWTKFSLWSVHIADTQLPEDIQDVLHRFELKGRIDVESELLQQHCTKLPLETISIKNEKLQFEKQFSSFQIALEFNPHRFNNLQQLTVLFPEDYRFLINQHGDNTLDWRKDYQIPRIINLISETTSSSNLSILLGTWVKESSYFIVNETKDARYLLIIQYNEVPVDISDIGKTAIDSRLIEYYQQGAKVAGEPSPYIYMIVDLENTYGNAFSVLSDDQKTGVYPAYCDFLAKYGVQPVAAGLNIIEGQEFRLYVV